MMPLLTGSPRRARPRCAAGCRTRAPPCRPAASCRRRGARLPPRPRRAPPRRCAPCARKCRSARSRARASRRPARRAARSSASCRRGSTVTCRPRSLSTLAASRPEQAAAHHDRVVAGAGVGAHASGSRASCGRRRPRRCSSPSASVMPSTAAPAVSCRSRSPPRRSGGSCRRPSRPVFAAVSSRSTTVPSNRRTPLRRVPRRRLDDDRVGAPPASTLLEQDAVVGAVRLLAEDRDVVARRGHRAASARRASRQVAMPLPMIARRFLRAVTALLRCPMGPTALTRARRTS